ncbi:mutS protein homolog 5-like isoform X1 [Apostichopus japonicus]|uniref:mutS protein homolog 5-like isoform X1 n=1 Tax=Stichopus japonicus TaxID=307972 RepID=UPI003AB7BF0E
MSMAWAPVVITKYQMLMTHQGLNTTPDQSMRLDFISDEDTVLRPTSGEDGIRSEEDKEDDIEIYLSVIWNGGKLGAACYNVQTAEIYMLKDTAETENFVILKKVCHQLRPKHVITSTKADERFLKAVRDFDKLPSLCGLNGDMVSVDYLPSTEFSLEVCKRRVMSIHLPTIPSHYTEADRTIFLSSTIPFDCCCLVRALGGLLKFLEKKRVGIELESSDSDIPILFLRTFSLHDVMFLDADTYIALQLFKNESHPSAYKAGGSGAKEGLSLFGILNRTRSMIGTKLMRVWFMQPSRDLDVLKRRLDAVSYFVNPRNAEVTSSFQDALKQIKNVPRILKLMKQAQPSVNDWQTLYKTAYNAISIGDICRAQNADIHIFKKISDSFTEDLHYVANIISKIVDFDESFATGRFVVRPNVDTDLDTRKRTYNGLPDLMTRVAKQELSKLSEDIQECNVIYLPQLGYLLAIPCTQEMIHRQTFEIPDLEFVFLSNNIVHYKSQSTHALDARLGDTQCEITDQETQIMHRLQDAVLEKSQALYSVMEHAAELDCLLAFAAAARENNYICPTLTMEKTLEIHGGRHPLQEVCVATFVANNTISNSKEGKVKFLTGPNASGKSVYLKQVGLISFMAHIGSFVPAESATIGMLDGIYTRIHTQESISVGLSTFMIDLNQMATALKSATSSSLVIIDEFGKGTDVADGTSLLVAILKHWLALEDDCPHLVVSTHFHSILKQGLLPSSTQLRCQTMEVIPNGDEMVFLYQLIHGQTDHSYASHISSMAGLPDEIIDRGQQVTELIKENKPIPRVDQAGAEKQLTWYRSVVAKLMEADIDTVNMKTFLQGFVIPTISQDGKSL